MKLTPIIINNFNTPNTCPDGTGPTSSNQQRNVSGDQDAKSPRKVEREEEWKLEELCLGTCCGGFAIGLLTAVILILRFIFTKEYIRGLIIEYFVYILLSGVTILLVAMPYALPLAVFVANVFTGRKMAWDNNRVRNSDAQRAIGEVTCLVIDRIEGPDEPEVWKAIQKLQSAGITVRMVTGDDVNTARSTAIKCGIIRPEEDFLVLEGKVFNQKIRDLTGNVKQELFDEVWPRLRVLAASTANDKYVLVKHIMESKLNPNGEVVAVTGQGADDIPAIKKADIGFALGIVGTVKAKEAADIVLTDDNISSVVKAVMWGRNANDSIAKFLQLQLSVNLVAVIVEVFCDCALVNNPFSAAHLVWIYLFVCSLASFWLCTEMPDPAILRSKPNGRDDCILSGIMLRNIIGQAVYQSVIIFILLFAGADIFQIKSGSNFVDIAEKTYSSPNSKAEDLLPTEHFTIIFNTFSLMTLFNGLNARLIHGQRNIFEGLFTNRIFYGTFIITAVAQVVIVQFIGMADTAPLTHYQWMWCFIFGVSVLLWGQVLAFDPIKRIQKRFLRLSPRQTEIGMNCTPGGRLHRQDIELKG